MSLRSASLVVVAGALVLACVIGLAVVQPLLPFQHQWARQRWEQRRPQHYELEVSWARGRDFGYVQAEVRDNRIVRAVDLNTGRPLPIDNLYSAGYFTSIDKLFDLIDQRSRPAKNWRRQLARYHPLMARWFYPCAAPLPRVDYNAEFGYPTSIAYYSTSCVMADFNLSIVQIKRFRLLP